MLWSSVISVLSHLVYAIALMGFGALLRDWIAQRERQRLLDEIERRLLAQQARRDALEEVLEELVRRHHDSEDKTR